MNALIISYDLRQPSAQYAPLIEAIKSLGGWWHHLESTWVVRTNLTASQARDKLTKHLRQDDEILVVQSAGVGAWYGFNDSGSNWLRTNL